MTSETPRITIYTDGGCDPNPGPGGWGAVLIYPDGTVKELSGQDPATTNNRMELTAAMEALRALSQPGPVDLYTDSSYLKKGISEWLRGWRSRGWRKSDGKPVENVDLWQRLDALAGQREISWRWVRGHAGNTYNERAHQLASAAIPREAQTVDVNRTQVYLRIAGEGNSGAFGWAAAIVRGEATEQLSGGQKKATVNGFALQAMITVLESLPPGEALQCFTNNGYLYDGITKWVKGWRRGGWAKPEKFNAAWQKLDALNRARDIAWVRFRNDDAPEPFEALRALAESARKAAS